MIADYIIGECSSKWNMLHRDYIQNQIKAYLYIINKAQSFALSAKVLFLCGAQATTEDII